MRLDICRACGDFREGEFSLFCEGFVRRIWRYSCLRNECFLSLPIYTQSFIPVHCSVTDCVLIEEESDE